MCLYILGNKINSGTCQLVELKEKTPSVNFTAEKVSYCQIGGFHVFPLVYF